MPVNRTVEQLRKEVWEANQGIFRAGLVTMHSGNVSGINREQGLAVIKPSGMDYDKMRPADMVTTDLERRVVDERWKPSVDRPHHLLLYRNRAESGRGVH